MFIVFSMVTIGCGGSPEFVFTLPTSDGAVVSFVATTTDPDVLAAARQELNRPEGDRRLYILGPLAESDGGHNSGWDWHFVPGEWELTDTQHGPLRRRPAVYRRCASALDLEDQPVLPEGSPARRGEIDSGQANSPHSLSATRHLIASHIRSTSGHGVFPAALVGFP